MCEIQTILHNRKNVIQHLVHELMVEYLICPISSMAPRKLFYNEITHSLELHTFSTHQCIFSPSEYIENKQPFTLNTDVNLRDIMSYHDFTYFLLTYAKVRNCTISDVFDEPFHDLTVLYFFDKALYKKYARKEADTYLNDCLLVIENNRLKYVRKSMYARINDGKILIPKGWINVGGINDECEMILTYEGINVRRVEEE